MTKTEAWKDPYVCRDANDAEDLQRVLNDGHKHNYHLACIPIWQHHVVGPHSTGNWVVIMKSHKGGTMPEKEATGTTNPHKPTDPKPHAHAGVQGENIGEQHHENQDKPTPAQVVNDLANDQ